MSKMLSREDVDKILTSNNNESERKILFTRVQKAFDLTLDLLNHVSEEALVQKLPNLPSNLIGEQLWCIVGARESYLKAIKNNGWNGFSCSLKDVKSKSSIKQSLIESGDAVMLFLNKYFIKEEQLDFIYLLLEHEIQHHGQLIRYIYGNKLTFPESWRQRYNV